MKYVYSGKGLGLGNFINMTPMLSSLSDHWKRPVPVFTESKLIMECYQDCPFIEFEDHPGTEMVFHTRLYKLQEQQNGKYLIPDYEFLWELGKRQFKYKGKMPHTYIDKHKPIGNYILFVNGAGAWKREYLEKKMITPQVYRNISNHIGRADKAVLGSEFCNNPLKFAEDFRGYPIQIQLALISGCKMLITNEGGLAHAAAAMNKPVFIMWKQTDRIKNMNPGKNTFYSYSNHFENFKKWYK
jgi:hypothetical protein